MIAPAVMPLMKEGACLSYSHGFNIVEEGMQIRKDLTVIMVAPKSPGTEVREEYKRGFGVPTLIAVHRENDPKGEGWDIAKAYAAMRAAEALLQQGLKKFEAGLPCGEEANMGKMLCADAAWMAAERLMRSRAWVLVTISSAGGR